MNLDSMFQNQGNQQAPNRSKWLFKYTCSSLALAAVTQRDFRKERVKWWEKSKIDVMAKIKDSGIVINESMSEKLSYSNNTNALRNRRGISVEINEQFQEDLSECMEKIELHKQLRDEYDGWIALFQASPHIEVELTHADWLYFFGTGK